MFRSLWGRHQMYCLSLGELVFNMDPYFEYDYITSNILLGKILGIIYVLVQSCWN
jgi:hypothetical protein